MSGPELVMYARMFGGNCPEHRLSGQVDDLGEVRRYMLRSVDGRTFVPIVLDFPDGMLAGEFDAMVDTVGRRGVPRATRPRSPHVEVLSCC